MSLPSWDMKRGRNYWRGIRSRRLRRVWKRRRRRASSSAFMDITGGLPLYISLQKVCSPFLFKIWLIPVHGFAEQDRISCSTAQSSVHLYCPRSRGLSARISLPVRALIVSCDTSLHRTGTLMTSRPSRARLSSPKILPSPTSMVYLSSLLLRRTFAPATTSLPTRRSTFAPYAMASLMPALARSSPLRCRSALLRDSCRKREFRSLRPSWSGCERTGRFERVRAASS